MGVTRALARGPSGMFTASTPAACSRRAPSMTFAVSVPRGGETSTLTAKRPSASLRGEAAALGERNRLGRRRAGRRGRRRDLDAGRVEGTDGGAHGADVIGRRAAAAADEAHAAGQDEPARVVGHVLRGGEVDVASLEPLGGPGVRLGGEEEVAAPRHRLQALQHRLGSDGAVGADHVGPEVPHPDRQVSRPRRRGRCARPR